MQEVYETLLGHLRDNPVMSEYLENDLPDWQEIWTEAMPKLSSGEKILVEIALAMYNGNGTARFADIFQVDRPNQQRILHALQLRLGQLQA
jgi:hypothetical protein